MPVRRPVFEMAVGFVVVVVSAVTDADVADPVVMDTETPVVSAADEGTALDAVVHDVRLKARAAVNTAMLFFNRNPRPFLLFVWF